VDRRSLNCLGARTKFGGYICFPDGDARGPTARIRMGSVYVGLVKLAVRRPSLIPTMLSAAWAFRANRWYRQPPFLPLPSKAYMRWRMETAYGKGFTVVPSEDLERYLRWGSDMRKGVKESEKW